MPRTKKEVEPINKSTKSTSAVKKATVKKKSSSTVKKTTTRKSTTKATSVKKEPKKISTKSVSKAKATKKVTKTAKNVVNSRKSSTKKEQFINILEYYDLPYRYNETTVKILAQTPKTLFVYWDISDNDRNKYIEKYGEYFFNDTYPVLIVYNKTLNYTQEIEISDFANSWYLSISDSNCEYIVNLGRRFKEYVKRNPNMNHKEDIDKLLSITTSNNLTMPNDHILFDKLTYNVKYRNVKTNEENYKSLISLLKNNNLLNFYNLYMSLYNVDDLSDLINLNNPSSGNPTSTFK